MAQNQNIGLLGQVLTVNTAANTSTITSTLVVGNTVSNTQIGWNSTDLSVMETYASVNSFAAAYFVNSNTGTNVSSDLSIYAGPITSNSFIDIGVVGNNYSNTAWSILAPQDGYVYSGNGNLSIGTQIAKEVYIFAGGTSTANKILTANVSAITISNTVALYANGAFGVNQVLTSNATGGVYWGTGGTGYTGSSGTGGSGGGVSTGKAIAMAMIFGL